MSFTHPRFTGSNPHEKRRCRAAVKCFSRTFSSSDAAQMKSNMSATALRSVRTGNKSLLHTDSHIWKWTLKHMRLRVVCDWSTPWANGFSQSEKLPWLTDACTTTHTQTSPCCAVLMVFLELPFSFRGVEGVRMAGVRKQSGLWVRGGNKKVSGFRKTSKLGRTKRKEQGTKWRCINRWEEWIWGGASHAPVSRLSVHVTPELQCSTESNYCCPVHRAVSIRNDSIVPVLLCGEEHQLALPDNMSSNENEAEEKRETCRRSMHLRHQTCVY